MEKHKLEVCVYPICRPTASLHLDMDGSMKPESSVFPVTTCIAAPGKGGFHMRTTYASDAYIS